MKKLYRSEKNKVFGGVCGGIGEYFDVDPVLIRVVFVFVTIFTGFFPGVIVYVLCLFIIPENPNFSERNDLKKSEKDNLNSEKEI